MSHINRSKRSIVRISMLFLAYGLAAYANTITVQNTNDNGPGSLRQAMLDALAGDTINFAPGVTGTVALMSSLPTIGQNLTIVGPGPSKLAIDGGGVALGWQIFSIQGGATVAISGLTMANGGSFQGGGGVEISHSTVTLNNCLLSGNFTETVAYGGGLANFGGTATVTNCVLQGNFIRDTGSGGAIYNSGTMTVANTALLGNSSDSPAGGIYNVGTLFLTNSTLSGNSASAGSAIWNASSASATLTNTTISGNIGPSAILSSGISSLKLQNTTVANQAPTPGGSGVVNCRALNGPNIVSQGYNLSDDSSCAPYLTQPGDLNAVGAGLDPNGPQYNGGPTPTIALLPGSPAIDAIPVGNCAVATDQRGVPRPQGPGCDIGAYEKDLFTFNGFFQPIGNVPLVNLVKAGQSIPVKFSLRGYFGLNILGVGYPGSQPVACNTGAPTDIVDQVADAGASSLSYDATSDTYTLVWKTDNSWAGSCRQLVVRLTDNLDHVANFSFK